MGEATKAREPRIDRPSTKNSRGRKLGARSQAIRDAVLALTREYEVMTVRQIFYQLETRGVVPKSDVQGYRPVQEQVLKMRREGLLPWEFISDGTRWMRKPESFDNARSALETFTSGYRRNLWQSQGVRCEVWLEKDALAGIVAEVTTQFDVPLMVSRGTSSATFIYSTAQQALQAARSDVRTCIFTLYDLDAGGERSHRAVASGLAEYVPAQLLSVERLGVTPAQVERWDLPTRPAKASDPEARRFAREFGHEAVELDAIPPNYLKWTIEDAIVATIDRRVWEREQIAERSERETLRLVAKRLPEGGTW